MVYTLACRDMGADCDYVSKGETKEQLLQVAGKHGKETHGYTDEMLQDPKTIEQINANIKEE